MEALAPYPFERLDALLHGLEPASGRRLISLAIGEPQASPPPLALQALQQHSGDFNRYPTMAGLPQLRQAAAGWLQRRFGLAAATLDPDRQLLPVCGTREGVFSLLQVLAVPGRSLVFANPFYQIYEGAAILGGMRPVPLTSAAEEALFEAPQSLWRDCAVLVLCSPHNPTGVALSQEALERLLELSDRHGFVIVSDECYSDLYLDESAPPAGLLGACAAAGRDDWRNCIVLHSLSKRSALAGMRSGFVAGDGEILASYLKYRTYHGASMPVPIQHASIACWNDDSHAAEQRADYRRRFDTFDRAAAAAGDFSHPRPDGGFYYWLPVPPAWNGDDQAFARDLWTREAVRVVPGSYLGRPDAAGRNPGAGHLRLALVADPAECAEAGERYGRLLASRP